LESAEDVFSADVLRLDAIGLRKIRVVEPVVRGLLPILQIVDARRLGSGSFRIDFWRHISLQDPVPSDVSLHTRGSHSCN